MNRWTERRGEGVELFAGLSIVEIRKPEDDVLKRLLVAGPDFLTYPLALSTAARSSVLKSRARQAARYNHACRSDTCARTLSSLLSLS